MWAMIEKLRSRSWGIGPLIRCPAVSHSVGARMDDVRSRDAEGSKAVRTRRTYRHASAVVARRAGAAFDAVGVEGVSGLLPARVGHRRRVDWIANKRWAVAGPRTDWRGRVDSMRCGHVRTPRRSPRPAPVVAQRPEGRRTARRG